MTTSLDRIVAIGFKRVGHWSSGNDVLQLNLSQPQAEASELLYAFAVDGELTYIGKTSQGLAKRMQGYRTPAVGAERGGSTNIRNNWFIKEALREGAAVELYVLDLDAV